MSNVIVNNSAKINHVGWSIYVDSCQGMTYIVDSKLEARKSPRSS
jgi:hypothetical protein